MISEEKAIHLVHLILEGTEKLGMVQFPKRDEAMHEAKRVAISYLSQLTAVEEVAKKRILSQKNAPLEGSREWDTLYQKYLEEEMRRRSG